jgi:hypothetical protein
MTFAIFSNVAHCAEQRMAMQQHARILYNRRPY